MQYNSRAYWSRNIPIGATVWDVDSSAYFSPDTPIVNSRTGEMFVVSGVEPRKLGIGGLA